MPTCIAIIAKGTQCTRRSSEGNERCSLHVNTLAVTGPNATAAKEMQYVHKKEIIEMAEAFHARREADPDNAENITRMYLADVTLRRAQQNRVFQELITRQRDHIRLTGVDPDGVAHERARARNREIVERRRAQEAQIRARNADIINRINNNIVNGGVNHLEAARQIVRERAAAVGVAARQIVRERAAAVGVAAQQAPPPLGLQARERPLAAFAADPQNVHTTAAVQQTKDIVAKIRETVVPEGYRWHPTISSKTPFEIGLECNLSQKAAWQMISQYAQDTSIYDIEVGIYGKVLDCVWQYVKASSDKEDLCRIIKRELEDNIGMCAQGNLSRICNVLAGYMEGIGSQESLSDRLGSLLPPLMELEDVTERIRQALVILRDNHVPEGEWDSWMDPLIEDEDRGVYGIFRDALLAV